MKTVRHIEAAEEIKVFDEDKTVTLWSNHELKVRQLLHDPKLQTPIGAPTKKFRIHEIVIGKETFYYTFDDILLESVIERNDARMKSLLSIIDLKSKQALEITNMYNDKVKELEGLTREVSYSKAHPVRYALRMIFDIPLPEVEEVLPYD